MSKLEQLIQELCPDGVEYKKFADIANYIRGLTYGKGDEVLNTPSSGIPVLRANNITLGYNVLNFDDVKYVKASVKVKANQYLKANDILICAGSGSKEHVGKIAFIDTDIPYVFGGFMAVIRTKNPNQILPRFLFHNLASNAFRAHIGYTVDSTTINNLNANVMNSFTIPVPPLEVQNEIVRILDKFTELTAELQRSLTTELTARKQQYKYYSQRLLTNSVDEYATIASVGKWMGGKTPSMANKSFWENGEIPWISSKDMKSDVLTDTQDYISKDALKGAAMTIFPAGTVAIVTRSGILKHTFPVAFVPFETTINQDIKALVPYDGVSARYVSLAMQAFAEDIRAKTKKQGGTVDSLDFEKVLAYEIPLPSYEEQLSLVKKMEVFDDHINGLTVGLSAEIEARQNQYEYYRDKLLTFKRKEA